MHHPAAGSERRDIRDRLSENLGFALQLQLALAHRLQLRFTPPRLLLQLLLQAAK
jgi:hypothetical protein